MIENLGFTEIENVYIDCFIAQFITLCEKINEHRNTFSIEISKKEFQY